MVEDSALKKICPGQSQAAIKKQNPTILMAAIFAEIFKLV